MRRYLVPAVAFLIVVLAFPLWLDFCHDPQVRAEALQGQQDTRDDSTHQTNERWKVDFMRRDVARDDSLKKLGRRISVARGEIAVLKTRMIVPTVGMPPDSLLAQLAVRDTIIAEQDTTIAQLDSTVTIWQAMSADRDTRIEQLEGESLAYRTSRDAWKHAARPGIFAKLGRAVPYIAAGYVLARVVR